jgi:NitT/TauT family transport system permease protein
MSESLPPAKSAPTLNPTFFWRLAENIPKPLSMTLTFVSIALSLLLWWMMRQFGSIDPKFLPAPSQVWTAAIRMAASGELWQDTIASLWRVGSVAIGSKPF